ncbi:synaptotagmin-1-like [Mercenaria mercenaria]|uniref:synaptotagmin-1-like n=1 Tax=Mercenaria mercenaria TaxID=6596 RepID=UPI00234E65EE|nr:synaptotagmin-1-like [Mercenaria mercenaria]
MELESKENANYLIAIYIAAPIATVVLLLACVYVYCYRRSRLNWYEKYLLEEHQRQSAAGTTENAGSSNKRGITGVTRNKNYRRRNCFGNLKPLKPIVEVIKSLKKLTTRLKSSSENGSRDCENKTEWIVCSRKRMGSSPSSPVHDPAEEKFWVPPAVLDRKRAQSLIPTTTQTESEEDNSSGTTTPASIGGLREFTYTFQSTPLISSDGLPSPIPPGNRQRRASMQDAIDFRKIDSKLYDRRLLQRQQSVASIEEDPLGSINFSVEFNSETSLLTVYLVEAENLVSRDFSGTSDPYCKVCVLPDRRNQLKSKIHRKTTNPVFDEEFIFEIDPDMLQTMTLELLIFDYDQFSRHDCIGQVKLPFENVDFSQRQTFWKPIAKREQKGITSNGDLIFSLGYLSSAERLTVVVMKARNLRHTEEGKITMDPYVKVLLSFGNGKKSKKKKTSTKHNVLTPVWNEALTFNLPKDYLNSVSLEFHVCHDNKMGNDEILGRTRISKESTGDERLHWDEMVNCRSAVARWHTLSIL